MYGYYLQGGLLAIKMVCGNATAVCGWTELFDGNPILAAFTMFDASLIGWSVAILFIVYQAMLFMKSRNLALNFITGVFFISLFATATLVKPISIQVMFVMLILEMAALIYLWVAK